MHVFPIPPASLATGTKGAKGPAKLIGRQQIKIFESTHCEPDGATRWVGLLPRAAVGKALCETFKMAGGKPRYVNSDVLNRTLTQ